MTGSCIESLPFEWRPSPVEAGSPEEERTSPITLPSVVIREIGAYDSRLPAFWTRAVKLMAARDVFGSRDFLPMAFAVKLTELSKAVGRVWVRNRDKAERKAYGTGFLVGPDLLITNNHVIRDAEDASHTVVWFNYQLDWNGREEPHYEYECQALLKHSPKERLDYSIVRLDGKPGDQVSGCEPISLGDHGPQPSPNKDHVVIIQHPQGRPKEFVVQNTMVRSAWSPYVQYEADTEPGSSGAPVFDSKLRIVALHHRPAIRKNQGVDIRYILDDASSVIP